jgi:modification methylase
MTNKIDEVLNEIYVGEALKEIIKFPDASIDITVTSPPYNKINSNSGWLVQNNGYSNFKDEMEESDYQEWQIAVLNELHRITKEGGSLFYNHKVRWSEGKMIHPYDWIKKSKWDVRQELIWDRTLAANVRGWRFWQVEERIYWLYRPIGDHLVGEELESRHAKMGSIWKIDPVPRNNDHPAAFPLEIPLRAIYSMVGEKKKIVLDPFAGTGTTCIAAKILNHHYIGIDLSPDYVEIANKRIENYKDELKTAEEEINRHVVNRTFKDRKKRGTINWPYGSPPDEID